MKILQSLFNTLDKAQVIHHIEEEVSFRPQYFMMLFLSVIIATLGLIIDNNAIIIGAMLLSPLIWPIIGISLATVRSTKDLMRKSLILLVVSLAFILVVAVLISFISPFKEVGSEILGRTTPTVFDLVIALAAGTAATLILTWPKFSDALAGVAIAASLLPPICVTGVGLAFKDMSIAYGSFILFLTNLASIIFAGIVVFALARFYRRDDSEYVKRLSLGLFISLFVIALIGVQLVFSLRQIIYEDTVEARVREVMKSELQKISQDISIAQVQIGTLSGESIQVNASIQAPTHVVITVNQKNSIVDKLSHELGRKFNVAMKITQVLEAVNLDELEIEKNNYQQRIEQIVFEQAQKISSQIEVQTVESNIKLNGVRKFMIDTIWQIPDSMEITLSHKEQLAERLRTELDGEVDIRMSLLRYFSLNDSVEKELNEEGIIEATKDVLAQRTEGYAQEVEEAFGIIFDYVRVRYDKETEKYSIKLGVRKQVGKNIPFEYREGLARKLEVVFYPLSALVIEYETLDYRLVD